MTMTLENAENGETKKGDGARALRDGDGCESQIKEGLRQKPNQKQKGDIWSFHQICKGKKRMGFSVWTQWQYTQTATHPTVTTKKVKTGKTAIYSLWITHFQLRLSKWKNNYGTNPTFKIQNSKFVNNKNKQWLDSHTQRQTPRNASPRHSKRVNTNNTPRTLRNEMRITEWNTHRTDSKLKKGTKNLLSASYAQKRPRFRLSASVYAYRARCWWCCCCA